LNSAIYLGDEGDEANRLLLILARDEHEYVRRRALGALARLGSSAVEPLAREAWHRPDEHQEWARMMALDCLHRIGSPHLEPFLAEAERDERQHLRDFAKRIRQGRTD
jgi:HEAT repeat protein